MISSGQPPAILLGVSPATPMAGLGRLLALQRAEEPRTPVLTQVVPVAPLLESLISGTFHVGLIEAMTAPPGLHSLPFQQEELAIALPARSPLLAYTSIPTTTLNDYPIIQWCPVAHEALHRQVSLLLGEQRYAPRTVQSFALMACMVAAGYGIGIAPRTRIVQAREWGVLMRPLSKGTCSLPAALCWSQKFQSNAIARFLRRARETLPALQPK